MRYYTWFLMVLVCALFGCYEVDVVTLNHESRIKDLELKVLQLECSHNILNRQMLIGGDIIHPREVCNLCNKIYKTYSAYNLPQCIERVHKIISLQKEANGGKATLKDDAFRFVINYDKIITIPENQTELEIFKSKLPEPGTHIVPAGLVFWIDKEVHKGDQVFVLTNEYPETIHFICPKKGHNQKGGE